MSDQIPLQDRLHKDHPIRACYGCGADNPGGLRLKSFVDGDELVANYKPQPHHHAYPGYLNGGIASTLIDCHSAWAASIVECRERGIDVDAAPDALPSLWTRAMTIEFLRPAPMDADLVLRAKVTKKGGRSRTVECSLYADGQECVKAEVVLVAAAD